MKTRYSTLLALLGLCAFNSSALADRNYQAWSVSCADVNGDSQTTYRAVDTSIDDDGCTAVTGYNDLIQKDTWVTERYDSRGQRIWRKTLASANGEARPVAIGTDTMGSVYVAGYLDVASEGTNFCLVKYRGLDGQELWKRTYNNANSSGSDQITAMEVKKDGSVAVTGFSVNNGNEDFYTILYDTNGGITWEKRHSTIYLDRPAAVTFAPNGDVVVAGKSRVFYLSCYCMVRYSAANGTVVRKENYDGTDDDEATDVAVDPSGNVIVTGRSKVVTNGNVDWQVRTIKYDSGNGWMVPFNSPDDDLNTRPWWPRVAVDAFGDVIMSCTSHLNGFQTLFYASKYKEQDGTQLWSNITTAPAGSPANYSMSDYVQEMEIDTRGDVVVTGTSLSSTTGDDILTVKFYAEDGRILWQQRNTGYTSSGKDEAASVAISRSGDVVVCGTNRRSNSSNYDTLGTSRYNCLQLSKGDPVRGTGLTWAAVVNTMSVPATLSDGSIMAKVTIKDGSKVLNGILHNKVGNWAEVLQGQAAPGVTGAKFATFDDPLIGFNDTMAFTATITGAPTGQTVGLWTDLYSANPDLVLQTGKQAPGLPMGVLVASIVNVNLNSNRLVAHITLKGTGVTAANSNAVIAMTGKNTATLLMRTGQAVSPFGQSSTVKTISIFSPPAQSTGHGRHLGGSFVAMKLTLADARIVDAFVNSDTVTVNYMAGTGASATAVVSGATYQSVSSPGLAVNGTQPASLATLKLGVAGVTTSNDSVLIAASSVGNAFQLVAREGASVPTYSTLQFATLGAPVCNTNNIAFIATIKGTGVTAANNTVVCVGTNAATLESSFREGTFAPDESGGVSSLKFGTFKAIAFPHQAALPIILSTVTGPGVTSASNTALFGCTSRSAPVLLLRTGNRMGSLTVKSFTVLNSPAKVMNSTRSFIGDAQGSTITALVTFTNLTQSIIRIDVP